MVRHWILLTRWASAPEISPARVVDNEGRCPGIANEQPHRGAGQTAHAKAWFERLSEEDGDKNPIIVKGGSNYLVYADKVLVAIVVAVGSANA
jgi:hypothetical protein